MTNPTPPPSSAELKSAIADCESKIAGCDSLRARFTDELVAIQDSRASGTSTTQIPVNDRAARKFSKALAAGEVLTSLEVPHSFERENELFIMRDGVDMRLKALRAELDALRWEESKRLAATMLPAWRALCREHVLLAVRLKAVDALAAEMLAQLVPGTAGFPLWNFVGCGMAIIFPGEHVLIDGGVDAEAKDALAEKIVTASEIRSAKNVAK
jgi:hypothetical protein